MVIPGYISNVTYWSIILYALGGNIPIHFHLVILTHPECAQWNYLKVNVSLLLAGAMDQ